MTDEANAEPTGKILSFPTEQRRVSVATERQSSEFMTPDDLVGMLTSSDLDILSGIDYDKINLSIDSYDQNDITYSWDEFISKVDFTAGPDKNIFRDTNSGTPGSSPDGTRNNDVDYIITDLSKDLEIEFSVDQSPIRLMTTLIDSNSNVYFDQVTIGFGR